MSAKTVWGIRAGRKDEARDLFLKRRRIGIGWAAVGDLSQVPAHLEQFKKLIVKHQSDTKPGAVPVEASQLFRFVHGMQVGDLVVYPSKQDRQIHIGEVASGYRYDPESDKHYPNQRDVKWLKSCPRTDFSQGTLYEIGSCMTLFQVKNYVDEIFSALEGKIISPELEEDETVGYVAEEIESATRDFILKQLAKELKGHGFAHFVAHLLQHMGYRTRVSPEGPDGGIDIIAHKDDLGFEPPIIKVQVKSGEGSVGDPQVKALYGNVGVQEYGLFVTLGSFTKPAIGFAQGKANLRLIDGDELIDLVLEYYEQFDSRYKRLLPLKRVYIPQPFDESGE